MNILNFYKRTRFFLFVNILGLAIGLAASIMLILFVVNELSYDKHFPNSERIVRLNTVWEENGNKMHYGINLRKAYTEIPNKVPGIETTIQIYNGGTTEAITDTERFQKLGLLYTDPEFFQVFQMKFVEGTPDGVFDNPNSVVITRKYADIMFGGASNALNKNLSIKEQDYVVSAIVEELPSNTHFTFDILANMRSIAYVQEYGGLEFLTYYLINKDANLQDVSATIAKEYSAMIEGFGGNSGINVYGYVENLTDIHLKSQVGSTSSKANNMYFVVLLIVLAVFILFLAITNFINLFMAQGEVRMNEIGIRKANGGSVGDIIRQFFSEVSVIVFIAFVIGFFLAVLVTPFFSEIIQRTIELTQLWNPVFIISIIGLFLLTVLLTASYPSFYLSRFNPLDILGKRIRFSKRRLISLVVIFQSVITIILISYILVINKQTAFLQDIPLNYNPKNVVSILGNQEVLKSYDALKQELLKMPEVEVVSSSHHILGGGCSGQMIGLLESPDVAYSINEYRIMPHMCEAMQFELIEGEFFKENAPDSIRMIILNEAAVKMLNLEYPVVGKTVQYYIPSEIVGVVKDFGYGDPAERVEPLVLCRVNSPRHVYIRFNENVDRMKAEAVVLDAFRKIDPDFIINPIWSEDIYLKKFESLKIQSKVIFLGSLLSVFIAMLGLLAIHLYSTIRRTKEIGIRRVNGAEPKSIFVMLSTNIIKWIAIASIIALPIAYYIESNWLNNYANHTSLGWAVFVIPVLIQCIIALVTTSGVSINILSKNPVEALKQND